MLVSNATRDNPAVLGRATYSTNAPTNANTVMKGKIGMPK